MPSILGLLRETINYFLTLSGIRPIMNLRTMQIRIDCCTTVKLFSFLIFCLVSRYDAEASPDLYFNYSINGQPFKVGAEDILTTYNEFSASDREFKIFVGGQDSPQLVLTIVADMSKPSSTPSGSGEPGHKLFQGSVSLHDYPKAGDTWNNFDGFATPKLDPNPGAIVITSSEKVANKSRVIAGTVNTATVSGVSEKPFQITGDFRIEHEFKGADF
jgi:hypothetical protein